MSREGLKLFRGRVGVGYETLALLNLKIILAWKINSLQNFVPCFVIKSRNLRDKTMANKLMYISNDITQNYPFLYITIVVETLSLMDQPNKF